LKKKLLRGENLEYAEVPSYWILNRSLLGTSIVGTVVFIILVIVLSFEDLSGTIYITGIFPILLGVIMFGYFFRRKGFVVLTDKRVILRSPGGDIVQFEHETIVKVQNRYNYLQCFKEIEISRKVDNPIPKSEFIDAIRNTENLLRLIHSHCNFETDQAQIELKT